MSIFFQIKENEEECKLLLRNAHLFNSHFCKKCSSTMKVHSVNPRNSL